MNPYLDSLDLYSEPIKAETKPKRDYAGIGAIIFTFTVMSIVIGLSIYTAWQIAYAQEPLFSERELGKIEGKMELLCKQNNGPWSELPEFWEKMCSPENLKNLTSELGNITNNTEIK